MTGIVFAFYKNDNLIGYRLDTMGSIGMEYPKVYSYSKDQVEVVLSNINHNVLTNKGFGEALGLDILKQVEDNIHELLQDQKAFEVRVLRSPGYSVEKRLDITTGEWVEESSLEYPTDEIEEWVKDPSSHEVIETHYFGVNGLLNLN